MGDFTSADKYLKKALADYHSVGAKHTLELLHSAEQRAARRQGPQGNARSAVGIE